MIQPFRLSTIVARVVLFATFALSAIPFASAQNSNVIYSSSRIPQVNTLNPALFPSNSKIFISLPGANINFNSPLSYSEIFQYTPGDTASYINVNALMDSLSRHGDLNFNANVYVAGVGFRFGKSFLTATVQAKAKCNVGIPSGLMTFINEGNYGYRGVGNELHLLDGDLLNAQAYGEAGLTYGRKFGPFTIGVRAKVFNGFFDLTTQNTLIQLYTSEDLTTLRADVAYQLKMAGILKMNEDFSISMNKITRPTNNWGYGFDLGLRYENSFLDLGISLLDIASTIDWTENVTDITPANGDGSFTFQGIDMNGLIHGGSIDTTFINNMTDSLTTIVKPQMTEGEAYTTSIPTKLNVSAMFKLNPTISAGVLFHGEFDKNIGRFNQLEGAFQNNGFRNTTTILAHINFRDWIELMASASVVGDGYNVNWFNPGFGVNVSLFRALQAYAVVDYLSNMYLVDAKSFNFYVGVNLMLLNDKVKKRK